MIDDPRPCRARQIDISSVSYDSRWAHGRLGDDQSYWGFTSGSQSFFNGVKNEFEDENRQSLDDILHI